MSDRILFMGQKQLGEACYKILCDNDNENICLAGVCTNPNSENVWWRSNRIAVDARSKGLPFVSNEDAGEEALLKLIEEKKVTKILSVQHPHILSERLLSAVNFRALNLHSAKLPEYRGSNACNHAILNGDEEFTVTLHWMTPKVDIGQIAFTKSFAVAADDTASSLYVRAIEASVEVFKLLVMSLQSGQEIPRREMVGTARFYARSSIAGLRQILDLQDAIEVDRKTRAFWFPPFEPAFFISGDRKYYSIPACGLDYLASLNPK